MSAPNLLNRRYELPNCLLEIWAERSPLSEWQSQIVAQNLKFHLRLGEGGKVIKGNQQQISYLIEAVTNYCDRWLAQDKLDSLTHKISIPKSSQLRLDTLKLSTLQLFDLYEGLELCASEFVILPHIVLEVRRISPNWLKIAASMLAIAGVSFGAIRLVSRDQASYQVSQPTSVSAPEITALAPSPQVQEKKQERLPQTSAPIPKVDNQAADNPSGNVSEVPIRDGEKIAPEVKGQTTSPARKEAIAIAPPMSPSASKPSIVRQRTNDSPSFKAPAAATLETPNSADTVSPESAPTESAKRSEESSLMRSSKPATTPSTPIGESSNGVTTSKLASIKLIEVKSSLPNQVYADLVRYIQSQKITSSAQGSVSFEIELSGQEVVKIELNPESSNLADLDAVQTLQKSIRQWRSPLASTGKIYIVLQIN
ncbi:MAG: hypothetical protein AUK48_00280 [Oscillatoriales cyanobacterium CG2_30_44_21]|nr:MAG: hypothetical protein AUK48_00280 [Oscillatoriales cyanobacterium CG2_30_44_21]